MPRLHRSNWPPAFCNGSDTRHPAFLAVTNVRHQLVATWQSMSLRYPVPSVRLIRQDKIDEFNLGWWNSRKAGIIRLEGFDHVQR